MSAPLISHSEVESYSLCKRRHYYSFVEKLQKKATGRSVALNRGILGHELFQVFWQTLQETGNINEAKSLLMRHTANVLQTTPDATYIYLAQVMNEFLDKYRDRIKKWDILHIEQEFRLDLGALVYVFKPDLIVRENGQLKLIDYKFVYDFYDDVMFELAPQIPRYVGALRALGMPITSGDYAFLRYRNVKSEGEGNRYKLQSVPLPQAKLRNAMSDLISVTEDIVCNRGRELDEQKLKASRTANAQICKSCAFRNLCSEEFSGGDGQGTRYMYYEPSTYGYVEAGVEE